MRQQRLKALGDVPLRGELGGREALFRLARYLVPLWRHLLVGLILAIVWSSINLGYGVLAEMFFKEIRHQVTAGTHDVGRLNLWAALGVAVFLVRGVLYFLYNFIWSYSAQRLSQRLRDEVFAHLQNLPISFFDHRRTGQILSSISNDIPAVNAVLAAVQDAITAPILFVGGVILLFILNWKLALVSCLCLPPTAWIIVRASARARTCSARVQESLADITGHADETLSGIRVVKAFGAEDYEKGRFDRHSRDVFRSILRALRVRLVMVPTVEMLGAIALIGVLWIGGLQIIRGEGQLTVERLIFFILVLRQVADGAKNLGGISVNLSTAGVAADRVFTLLAARSDVQDPPEAIELTRVAGRVQFDRVGFAYSPGIPVLADISFTMEPGEVVALVGPTGSGKTTIAALIPRFYEATEGVIRVDGTDIRHCTLRSLRRQIGVVPQDNLLFSGTLRDNIAYGSPDAAAAEIERAARMANAWEFIERLPEGLNTMIGERGTRLSGGQRQRIAIARAILRDPRILILDEATSSLDAHSEALIQDALQKLVRDRTTLVIAHRLSTIRNADRILVIQDGHIVETGTHTELLGRNGVYAELYSTQFRAPEPTQRALDPLLHREEAPEAVDNREQLV